MQLIDCNTNCDNYAKILNNRLITKASNSCVFRNSMIFHAIHMHSAVLEAFAIYSKVLFVMSLLCMYMYSLQIHFGNTIEICEIYLEIHSMQLIA